MSKRFMASALGVSGAAAILAVFAPACSSSSSGGTGTGTDAGIGEETSTPGPDGLDCRAPDGSSPGGDASSTAVDAGGDAPALYDGGPIVFTPSNFTASAVTVTGIGDVTIMSGDQCTFDTDDSTFSCNSATVYPVVTSTVAQSGGSSAVLYAFKSFSVPADATMNVQGNKPAILYVLGAVDIEGTFDTNSNGVAMSSIGNGGDNLSDADATGAAGGSFCGAGGYGANASDAGSAGGAPGKLYGSPALIPLQAGSLGGNSNGYGAGGGSIQITSTVSIVVGTGGAIGANGFKGASDDVAGGGGGSGGGILLEAPTVTISGVLAANGGGAGDASGNGSDGTDTKNPAAGAMYGGAGSNDPNLAGGNGAIDPNNNTFFGGGGGGAGRIRINTATGVATVTGIVSPALSTSCSTQGTLAH